MFGRLLAPGALASELAVVEAMQLHHPLLFPDEEPGDGNWCRGGAQGAVLLDAPGEAPARRVQILSKGGTDEGWTLYAQAQLPAVPDARTPTAVTPVDLERLRASSTAPRRASGSTSVPPSARWGRSGPGLARRWARWRSRQRPAATGWKSSRCCWTAVCRWWRGPAAGTADLPRAHD